MENNTTLDGENCIYDYEIKWMLAHRSLSFNINRAELDYGVKEASEMVNSFKEAGLDKFLDCTNWPGIGTRWKIFLQWLKNLSSKPPSPLIAFEKFAQYLGRVTSFRALSLTTEQFKTIQDLNTIVPTGRLKASEGQVNSMIEKYGVFKIAYARLYIGRGLVEFDPSLSLHDDPETAVTIAGGYLSTDKQVYLMGLSVPKIEFLGYILVDLQDDEETWFNFRGIYFNARKESTERYCLYEIPFYKERIRKQIILPDNAAVDTFIAPFRERMKQEKEAWEKNTQASQSTKIQE